MNKTSIQLFVNNEKYDIYVDPSDLLIDVLRDKLGLTGTKQGCGQGECGSCTINLNGKAALACMILAVQADGQKILTIEGLQKGLELHPLQKAFISESAVQCGYCTPGMIMASKALIDETPLPDKDMVKEALAGNLCRCTGYQGSVKAVLKAAADIEENNNG